MYWTVSLHGGPQRVNHAAVIIGEKVYSFGGYCSGENYHVQRPIDVHILNTGMPTKHKALFKISRTKMRKTHSELSSNWKHRSIVFKVMPSLHLKY